MLTIKRARPHPLLQPFVHLYVHRQTFAGAGEIVEPVVARLGAMLEFQFATPYEIPVCGTTLSLKCPRIVVVGPVTHRRVQLVIRDHVEALVVLFTPLGFRALFGIPMQRLTDVGVEGDGALGNGVSALYERLGNTVTFSDRTRILDSFLISRLCKSSQPDLVTRAFERLIVSGQSVTEVARQSGMSERQLERKALDYMGLSPKMLVRIARFQRAVRIKTQSASSWTEVAQSAGYYDQMHMVRDFREFAGDSPSRAVEQISSGHLIILSSLRSRLATEWGVP